jgi:outer membrane protein
MKSTMFKCFRRSSLTLAGLLFSSFFSSALVMAQDVPKIGFVNLDRILRDAPAAVAAQKKIEAEFARKDQEIGKLAEQLKKLEDTMQKNGPTMADGERRNKERELGELGRELQRRQRDFREELNQRRNEELSGVLEQANRAVRQIAETEKYDMVFQEAVWVNPRIDITDKVIKVLGTGTAAGRAPAAGNAKGSAK